MAEEKLEKFPDLEVDTVTASRPPPTRKPSRPGMRRKSSGLPSDIRGDTSAPALSTLEYKPTAPTPPTLSPRVSGDKVPRVSKRSRVRRLLKRWKKFSWTHTWANPLALVLIILSLYAVNPSESNPIHPMLFLSYALPRGSPDIPDHGYVGDVEPVYYGKGKKDLLFVSFYIIVLSFTREFAMQRIIRPVARAYGFKKGKQARFMEQAYTAMYFSIFGPYGLYVMSRTPLWYFETRPMFETFPHKSHEAIFKAYYLLQASYWAQQAIVLMLQLEKPRKDFKELVAHHIVTLGLIGLSYRFHFTYMGLAVYITHDVSDFFLATSKLLNYIESPIVIPYFSLFIAVWTYTRHYINLRILWATLTEFRTVGPFDINWETQQYKCPLSQWITFSLLATLQSINIFWLYLILKIALRVITDNAREDVRSEGEDSDEEEEEEGGDHDADKKRKQQQQQQQKIAQKATGTNAVPQVHLNGRPVNGSISKNSQESSTPRREGLRKR